MFELGLVRHEVDYSNEKSLIRDLKAMEEDAITWVWQTYYPALLRYATRMTRDENLADEMVSVVFERFLRAIHKGKGPNKHVKFYLYRMVYNVIIDEHRLLTRFEDMEDDAHVASDSPSSTYDQFEQQEKINAALNQLTPDQRDLIILRFVEGLTMKECAKVMSKTINSIKTLQGRALRRLRKTPEFIEMGKNYEPA